ncbi:transposase IS481 family protein [Actinoplanes teichomyceticus]|uniref:Transposase IS481 family protein n=1 Tax=Actinoplanes teichomyceticus TaxID=1867 RepID=A0A561VSD8_ACTTI|nr:leucine zipper domain-containing protein [Actinoplanes teichomyceticus]TWG14500.1 transposase IS481 family protein [Actinoplanes teichomyceticus]
MADRNARLTVHGRRLLVQRVVDDGWPVEHSLDVLITLVSYRRVENPRSWLRLADTPESTLSR